MSVTGPLRDLTRGGAPIINVVGVEAFALCAMGQLGVVVAAIATIPIAAANVVAVVTVAVAFPARGFTFAAADNLPVVSRIQASASVTVGVEVLSATAVTAIPVATAVVVAVVTVSIAGPVIVFALRIRAVVAPGVKRIKAGALAAVDVRVLAAAAVTAVPIAAAHVVLIITETIGEEALVVARSHAITLLIVGIQVVGVVGVQAEAIIAVGIAVGRTAAITVIPIATAVVVVVVAEAIADVVRRTAVTIASGVLSIGVSWVNALALSAETVVVLRTTAVTTVPVAGADVVAVVTVAVSVLGVVGAIAGAVVDALVGRVVALAVCAVDVQVVGSTAVTAVPIAVALVVVVVTETVALEVGVRAIAQALIPRAMRRGDVGCCGDLHGRQRVCAISLEWRCGGLRGSRAVRGSSRDDGEPGVRVDGVTVAVVVRNGGRWCPRVCNWGSGVVTSNNWGLGVRCVSRRRGSCLFTIVAIATATGAAAFYGDDVIRCVGDAACGIFGADAARAITAIRGRQFCTRHAEVANENIARLRGVPGGCANGTDLRFALRRGGGCESSTCQERQHFHGAWTVSFSSEGFPVA